MFHKTFLIVSLTISSAYSVKEETLRFNIQSQKSAFNRPVEHVTENWTSRFIVDCMLKSNSLQNILNILYNKKKRVQKKNDNRDFAKRRF